jgi:predicted AlkP superfamily phosphohydrolase/phosphomutase
VISISHPRVVIFGLDGGTFDVIRPLAAGRLPVLARLMAEGSHGVLQATLPPITPTGWTSFMTGKHPGSHGLYDFVRFVPGSYTTQPVSAGTHGHHSLWRIVSEQGMRVIAPDVPFT